MRIVTHGCSMTKYNWKCWPEFLQWFTDATVVNKGQSGSGNETIARGVVDTVLKKEADKIYVMWSGPDRYELIQDYDPDQNQATKMTYGYHDDEFEWTNWIGGHFEKTKDDWYKKHFLHQKQNRVRTLQWIIYTQFFLQKYKIEYHMMVMNKHVITHESLSRGESRLYNEVDWSKFIWYDDKKGLQEFQEENYPEQTNVGDWHPAPYAHYEWLRQIVLKTDQGCPPDIKEKMIKEKR